MRKPKEDATNMIAPIKRRRGRPRNEGNNGLVTSIHLRLTAEQRSTLEAWAGIACKSLSTFMREELAGLLCDKISEKTEGPTLSE